MRRATQIILLVLSAVLFPFPLQAQFSGQAVDEAIKKGTEFLLTKQLPDGSWGPFGKVTDINYSLTGPTALAVYSLMECEVGPQDPRIAKALKWLSDKREDGTYGLGLRANAWLVANRGTQDAYRRNLDKDARQVYLCGRTGGFYYTCPSKNPNAWDNSNSQYAVLAVWAAILNRGEVPREFWKNVENHWTKTQCKDGGWPYSQGEQNSNASSAAMTAGGVATLFVCIDNLYADEFIKCGGGTTPKSIQGGLDWLDKNFPATMAGQKLGHSDMFYYLYALQRVGLASGYKYFGSRDWYKEGATFLLKTQGPGGEWNGHWGAHVATAYALLFLIHGKAPVVFNKLQYEGDWNNRPRDLASVTRWMSQDFERPVSWQIINLKAPVSEWHDAPILYIAGSKAPKFSDEDIQKMRSFILQGGTIFSVTECNGAAFKKGMLAACTQMFPKYEFKPCGPEHDIYSRNVHFALNGRPNFSIMTNGVRPLVIHTDSDLPLPWQQQKIATQKWTFEAAANVVKYITDNITLLRPRGVSHWPPDASAAKIDRTVKIARLKHSGNYDPEPLAYERFCRKMAVETATKVDVAGPLDAKDLAASGAKLAVLTGTGKLALTADEGAALKFFVAAGGVLFVDAAGGSKAFAESAEKALGDLFGQRLRALSSTSPLFQIKGMELDKVHYRRQTRVRLGNLHVPNVRAVLVNDKPVVIFSAEDVTAGLVGYPSYSVDGYEPASAYELLRNVVLYAAGQAAPASTPAPTGK